jgi:Uma2 family endonuclease
MKSATYQDVLDAPENMVAELLDGELFLSPRPGEPHARAEIRISSFLTSRFEWGESGGPGGWVFRVEPEIHIEDKVVVPDVAGWRKERFVKPEKPYYEVIPDWLCEIASPSTAKIDRKHKLPLYLESGVQFVWLVDPVMRALDVYGALAGKWYVAQSFAENEVARAKPFEEIDFDLTLLWV